MNNIVLYRIGAQMGLRRNDIDRLIDNNLQNCSKYCISIMKKSSDIYKGGTHYGTISPLDFE